MQHAVKQLYADASRDRGDWERVHESAEGSAEKEHTAAAEGLVVVDELADLTRTFLSSHPKCGGRVIAVAHRGLTRTHANPRHARSEFLIDSSNADLFFGDDSRVARTKRKGGCWLQWHLPGMVRRVGGVAALLPRGAARERRAGDRLCSRCGRSTGPKTRRCPSQ